MESLFFDCLPWQHGILRVVYSAAGPKRIFITEDHWKQFAQLNNVVRNPIICREACDQLAQYLAGTRKTFTVPIEMNGSPFQKKVWRFLQSIPYGQTITYHEVAQAIGSTNAARAVGQANRCNPLPLIIPCHRVIAKNGSLSGYLGNNVAIKRFLLDLEKTTCK